jgi:hypothetical protein
MLCFERNYVVTGSELYSAIPGRGLTGNEKGQNDMEKECGRFIIVFLY